MPKRKAVCRVCGKTYEACNSLRTGRSDVFNWREVACSPECGATYLARVMASRYGEAVQAAEETGVYEEPEAIKGVIITDDVAEEDIAACPFAVDEADVSVADPGEADADDGDENDDEATE